MSEGFTLLQVCCVETKLYLSSVTFYTVTEVQNVIIITKDLSKVLSSFIFTIREPRCENIGIGKRGEPETAPLLTADGHISVVTR